MSVNLVAFIFYYQLINYILIWKSKFAILCFERKTFHKPIPKSIKPSWLKLFYFEIIKSWTIATNQSLCFRAVGIIMVVKPVSEINTLLLNHLQPLNLRTIFFDLLFIISYQTSLDTLPIIPSHSLLSQLSEQRALTVFSLLLVLQQLLLYNWLCSNVWKIIMESLSI